MGAIENIKDVLKLAQTVGNADLYDKLNAVQMDFLELSEKARQLQEENHELREKVSRKERMDELFSKRTHRDNAYWVDNDGPYCTGCWDSNDKPVRMTTYDDTGFAVCPVCKLQVCYDHAASAEHDRRFDEAHRRQSENDPWP